MFERKVLLFEKTAGVTISLGKKQISIIARTFSREIEVIDVADDLTMSCWVYSGKVCVNKREDEIGIDEGMYRVTWGLEQEWGGISRKHVLLIEQMQTER